MYPISDTTRLLLDNEVPLTAKLIFRFSNGQEIIATEADIITGGLTVDRYSQTGDEIQVGTVVSQELTVSFLDSEKFKGFNLESSEVFLQIGLQDILTPRGLTTENGQAIELESGERLYIENRNELPDGTIISTIPIPMGYYIVDTVTNKTNGVDISALDRMMLFDKTVDPSKLVFPCTTGELLLSICDTVGVLLKNPDISSIPNSNYTIDHMPDTENLTYRTLLNWIAQICGCCAFMDWDGLLCLEWYKDTGLKIDESQRYSSSINENPITITGIQVEDELGNIVHNSDENYDPTYVIRIEGNSLIQNDATSVANNLSKQLVGFTYTPFEANTVPMPYLWTTDMMTFVKNGIETSVILTNVNFTLNGTTALAGKGKTEAENQSVAPQPFTPQQSKVYESLRRETNEKIGNANDMSAYFSGMASTAMGLYRTEVDDGSGGKKIYMHDAPVLEDSKYICTANANGTFYTNSGWNNGNPVWIGGTDKNANALVSLLDAIGIKAEWIRAETITTDKLSIGATERGTNLLSDSSFESNSLVQPAEYDEETGTTLLSPAQNDAWKAVTFGNSTEWDITDSNGFPNIGIGGFDGNRAVLDSNLKGLDEGESIWYMGIAQKEPCPIEILTHTVSFYYRALRYPYGMQQGTQTAHFEYAFKIQWLDVNKVPISTTYKNFQVESNGSTDWKRLYTQVTPPNGAAFADFAIGYICTDNAEQNQDEITGESGYIDKGFASLDGILFEPGTDVDLWTCSASEVNNNGVLIDSNGFMVDVNKMYVKSETGEWLLYADADHLLTLIGNLITQVKSDKTGKVYGQVEYKSTNSGAYSAEEGVGLLGQRFYVADKNGSLVPVGNIGFFLHGAEDPNRLSEPLTFTCENGYQFGVARPLISDAQRVVSGQSINNLKTPGWYYCPANAEAQGIDGLPEKTAFVLRVEAMDGMILQTWTHYTGNRFYTRYYQTWEPAGWKQWDKFTSDGSKVDYISTVDGRVDSYFSVGTYILMFGDDGSIHANLVMADEFIDASERSKKENIVEQDSLDAIKLIETLKFYSYDYKSAVKNSQEEKVLHNDIGVMVDESPSEILNADKTGINLYSFVSLCAKAIQDLSAKVDSLENKLINIEKEENL